MSVKNTCIFRLDKSNEGFDLILSGETFDCFRLFAILYTYDTFEELSGKEIHREQEEYQLKEDARDLKREACDCAFYTLEIMCPKLKYIFKRNKQDI
ncbi:hypothetical protein CDAR_490171 [Caerostris darwini]|uniref:Uncharacterized protein n=1 Tax=Caerostris darwini TaxID=1538125 RepID=A0AAV4TJI4_9ARAC|nr:hypothetical protein CDAR_490171 [Caerostris darwini]